jgi:predicted peptidase
MIRFFFLLMLPLLPAAILAQAPENSLSPAAFQSEVKIQGSYKYLISLPDGYAADTAKQWPLIVFLHGSGERGDNLEALKTHGPTKLISQGKKIPAIVVAPQCPAEEIWNPHVVKALADDIKTQHRVDASRVYLTGLSMGGFGTWETAMEYPAEWAALVPICGGIGVRFVMASKMKDIPQWIFHGEKDTVVPPQFSKEVHKLMQKMGGAEAKLTIYPKAAHDSWTAAYEEEALWTWLFAQKRPN